MTDAENDEITLTMLALTRTVRIETEPVFTNSRTTDAYFEGAGIMVLAESKFQSLFTGLEIEFQDECEYAVHQLTKDSSDELILRQLGDKVELSVFEFSIFLDACRDSLNRFIFYLRGIDGRLYAVCTHWLTEHERWAPDVTAVGSPLKWEAGAKVVSRNKSYPSVLRH